MGARGRRGESEGEGWSVRVRCEAERYDSAASSGFGRGFGRGGPHKLHVHLPTCSCISHPGLR
jgi:hypothetical protein